MAYTASVEIAYISSINESVYAVLIVSDLDSDVLEMRAEREEVDMICKMYYPIRQEDPLQF